VVDTSRHEVTERGFTFFSTVRGSVSNASGALSNSSIASHDKCIVCGTSGFYLLKTIVSRILPAASLHPHDSATR
jgi:hypothetical protein